jgi:hypothetical protein
MTNKSTSFNTPVLFTIFNRPEQTQTVFNAIRYRRPKQLYVAADGPRANVPDDLEKCMKTRSITDQIDWDCDCKTLFQDRNKGCAAAMVTAIDWFFDNVERGIILEDDCLPHKEFFDYCEILLDRYENNEQVMLISGDNFQNGKKIGQASYYFSAYNHIWGWASWKKTWENYIYDISELNENLLIDRINEQFISKKESSFWISKYNNIMRIKKPDFWDYQFAYSLWYNKGLSVIPNVNLVSNIGFGDEATHTFSDDSRVSNIRSESILPLVHPDKIIQNKKADKRYFELYLKEKTNPCQKDKEPDKKNNQNTSISNSLL